MGALMKMKGLLLIVVSFCLTGCPLLYYDVFANHTTEAITLETHPSDHQVTSRVIEAGHAVVLDGDPLTMDFSIESSHRRWNYSWPLRNIPSEWVGRVRQRPTFYFQLEPDGRIYLQRPSSLLPNSSLPRQIDGYPIAPEQKEGPKRE